MNDKSLKRSYFAMGTFALLLFLLFNHTDIAETSQHAWILLQSTFDGDFMNYYRNVADRVYDFGFGFVYYNSAHYNIIVYILFALWELPVYLIGQLLHLSGENIEFFLYFWVKLLCVGALICCAGVVQRIALRLGASVQSAKTQKFLTLFCPISLFCVFMFGGYDMFCLLFVLLALEALFDNRLVKFALLIGVASAFKFFALILFIPLLLLHEKRILHLAKLGILSLWLTAPATLLFMGRSAESSSFNYVIAQRFFYLNIPTAYGEISVFFLLYAIICVLCFMYRRPADLPDPLLSLYLCLLSLALVFTTISWHPQWMILLVPFLVLLASRAQNRNAIFWLCMVFCVGYFLCFTFMSAGTLDADLLKMGILHRLPLQSGSLIDLLARIPLMKKLSPVCYVASMLSLLVALFPRKGQLLCDQLVQGTLQNPYSPTCCVWGLISLGFFASYLIPMAVSAVLF